jgi:hypothetical protein
MGAAPSGQVAVEMEYEAEDEPVDYFITRGGDDPGTAIDTIQVTGASLMKKPVATQLRDRPWAYTLPRDAEDAVALLLRHGITVERLIEPAMLNVQAYTVAGVEYERQYNHDAVTRIQVGEVVERSMELPTGTYVVPTAQNLGRLVAHMLEVETEDNVVYWNRMDAWVPRPSPDAPAAQAPLSPIYKIMAPVTLKSMIVGGS